MPDVWIGFNSDDRRRYWWRNGVVTLALAAVMVAMSLTVRGPVEWWLFGALGVFSVAVLLSEMSSIYGRVLLTAAGLEFRTLFSRRSIPWSEVAGIERRQRVLRSGIWSDLRIVRGGRRSLTIPGTSTNRMRDAELERKQAVIQERWSLAMSD
ncbi:PH domain-containing protein [Streptomyces sp. VRA16 Mangrove soil]|uniref:PH domain-containing protein n=1 Tax=Streptomyces sp. VRA16 Mangrove soil TaxID=2817434 RepID=UPI001A9E64F5|nr:PH domain-containing protein [Streptomyces sp. VRA16 Mangrove soil]MBO1332562.1 PH domain-containing protein [Streptomyces sp. VRA16 Mangrove soil]